MSFGIQQFFQLAAGADWRSPNGGLSAGEFTAALNNVAGADHALSQGEFRELGQKLGLSGSDSTAIFNYLEHNGQVSVDSLRDRLMKAAGANQAFNLNEFKGGVDALRNQAAQWQHHKHHVNFDRAAGADGQMNEGEFAAMAKQAGITDDSQIQQVFNQIAGAGGTISSDQFKAAFGGTNLSNADFRNAFNQVAGGGQDVNFDQAAGADGQMNEAEFAAMCKQAGITDENQIQQVFNQVAGADGQMSSDEFTAAFGGTNLSNADFKTAFNQQAGSGQDVNFDQAAGADGQMNEAEFAAMCKQAGITDDNQIRQVFDKVAGADGKMSADEFKAAFGSTSLSSTDFQNAFNQQAQSADPTGGTPPSTDPTGPTGGNPPGRPDHDHDRDGGWRVGDHHDHDWDGGRRSGVQDIWSSQVNGNQATLNLGKDYTISVNKDDSSITIKNNTTNTVTRIWGDPHVDGAANFNFHDPMTFQLANGAKLTIGTEDAGNGTTRASSLTITDGDRSFQVTNLGGGAGPLDVQQSDSNGWRLDRMTWDGANVVRENPSGTGWTERGKPVTQALINAGETLFG